jgi:uncharacterized BrkB/YihY/UPF0761 family membrane protein
MILTVVIISLAIVVFYWVYAMTYRTDNRIDFFDTIGPLAGIFTFIISLLGLIFMLLLAEGYHILPKGKDKVEYQLIEEPVYKLKH